MELGRRCGFKYHNSSADQSLKQNGVFSPVLLDSGSVEDLKRQNASMLLAGRATTLLVTRRYQALRQGLKIPITYDLCTISRHGGSMAMLPPFQIVESYPPIWRDASNCVIECGTLNQADKL